MQNRYVGDIGDYLKLSILRALSPGYRLGVAWWLYPDESHNQDGRHTGYLGKPEEWRRYDPQLFDALAQIVRTDRRNVRALEAANVLPGAIFASEVIPFYEPVAEGRRARQNWFSGIIKKLAEADLVFVDPDNGLEPDGYRPGSAKAGKSILISDLQELARPGRCLIVYHHHTRRKGGHHGEIGYWADRLRASGFVTVDALRARPFSPRVFFLLDGLADVRQRAERIADHWEGLIAWHPDTNTKAGLCVDAMPIGRSSPTTA